MLGRASLVLVILMLRLLQFCGLQSVAALSPFPPPVPSSRPELRHRGPPLFLFLFLFVDSQNGLAHELELTLKRTTGSDIMSNSNNFHNYAAAELKATAR